MEKPLANVKALFDHALEIEAPAERNAYLDEACAGIPEARQKVEALLKAYADAGSFLESGAGSATAAFAGVNSPPEVRDKPGSVVAGRYKLLEAIGAGGMGVVYMAEQQEPLRRMVALKIIKPGMDSSQVLARFEAERQALALMDHPNIAKVLDAGATADGRPFFVMELVKGTPITAFCDANKLSARQRLELFVPVCQAIQHAHQKGVIHRDVKPSNVLIALYDDKPVPKVIDFGVAKAAGNPLTERSLHTGFGAIVGTPEYMSPEQATFNQLDIDTRSDVYSLGVLLYELLTGSTPVDKTRFKEAAILEVLRVVREEEPLRPSVKLSTTSARASIAATRGTDSDKLAQLLRGELDWIVMKSLEKDRSRRYETANGMAQDVRRYLNDEPVQAGPPSAGYRLRKFVKRNRGSVTAAAVVLTTLLAGIVGTSWGWIDAVQARKDEADQRATAVKAITKARDAEAAKAKAEETARIAAQSEATALDKARKEAIRKTRLVEANLALERAMNHCQSGEVAQGLLWLARGLEVVPEDEPELPQSFRRLLAGWSPQVHPLQQVLAVDKFTRLSPNGKVIAEWQGNPPSAVQLRDADTGKPLGKPIPQPEPSDSVIFSRQSSFSPDSKLFVSVGFEKSSKRDTLRFWDVVTGQPVGGPVLLTNLSQGNIFDQLAISPDSKRLATYNLDEAGNRLWDVATGKPVGVPQPIKYVRVVLFSPDSKTLLTAGVGPTPQVHFWDTETGRPIGKPLELSFEVNAVDFSPDGKSIVAGGSKQGEIDRSGRIEVIAKATGNVLAQQRFPGAVEVVAFSPDGKTILAGYHGSQYQLLRFLPSQNEASQVALLSIGYPIQASSLGRAGFAFSPDGNAVLVAYRLGELSRDLLGEWHDHARLWDTATGKPLGDKLQHSGGGISWVRFAPDGQSMMTGSGVDVRRWQVARAPVRRQLDTSPREFFGSSAFSPNGKTLVVSTSMECVRFWDPGTGKPAGQPIRVGKGAGVVQYVAYSPNAQVLLTVDGPGPWKVRLWDAATHKAISTIGDLPRLMQGDSLANHVVFSPDSRHVLLAAGDSARLWDIATGKPAGTAIEPKGGVWAAAISPDGTRIATGGGDHTARIWDAETGGQIGDALKHPVAVNCVAFSADGKTLLTNAVDTIGRLWNVKTGQPVGEPFRHATMDYHPLHYSPDSKLILSAGRHFEGSPMAIKVRLWDAATAKPRGPYLRGSDGRPTSFSPDGKTIISGVLGTGLNTDGSQVFDAATGQPIGKPLMKYHFSAFSLDSRTLLLKHRTDFPYTVETLHLFDVPQPLPGDPVRLRLWVEVITGRELDAGGEVANLDAAAWQQHRERLEKLGGPPLP